MKPRFKFLTGDINWEKYGGTWLSQKLNNGEFDYYLAIRFMNWEEETGERPEGSRYHIGLLSVSPSEAGPENLASAFNCCGTPDECKDNPIVQCDALLSYGVYAPLWQTEGNNVSRMMREARKQSVIATALYGFYMDQPKNRIGNSGWDCQKGQIGFRAAAQS